MRGNNGYARFKWENVCTNAQEEEMIEATLKELKKLLDSPAIKDIRKHSFFKVGSEVAGDPQRLAIDKKGLCKVYISGGDPTNWNISEEKYRELIREFKVVPGELYQIRKNIETPLTKPKRKK